MNKNENDTNLDKLIKYLSLLNYNNIILDVYYILGHEFCAQL